MSACGYVITAPLPARVCSRPEPAGAASGHQTGRVSPAVSSVTRAALSVSGAAQVRRRRQ